MVFDFFVLFLFGMSGIMAQSFPGSTGYLGGMTCPGSVLPLSVCGPGFQCSGATMCYNFPLPTGSQYYCCPTGSQQPLPGQSVPQFPAPLQSNLNSVGTTAFGQLYPDAMAQVKDDIRQNPVMLFTKTTCPHCYRAKGYLQQYGIAYRGRDVNLDEPGMRALVAAQTLTGQQSVPIIFVCGWHIGDADGLLRNMQSGFFYTLLNQCAPTTPRTSGKS